MLSEKIKELRLSFGISQVKLAEDLGVSKQCVSNWENDNVQPSVDMLIKIVKYFNVSCDYMLGIQSQTQIDVSGLKESEIAHVKMLVKDLLNR